MMQIYVYLSSGSSKSKTNSIQKKYFIDPKGKLHAAVTYSVKELLQMVMADGCLKYLL